MLLRTVIGLVSLLVASSAYGEDDRKWLCIGDAATGFSYSGGEWRQTKFRVKDKKYILRKKEKRDGKKQYYISKIGDTWGGEYCKYNGKKEEGNFNCGDLVSFYKVSTKDLRFLYVYSGVSHLYNLDDKRDTPIMVLGSCAEL